jgi:hypothetical protein
MSIVTEAPAPVRINAAPDSRLAQLAAAYAEAKAQANEAADRLDGITDALKAEMTTAAPDSGTIELDGPVPLRLSARESWRLDTAKLKAADPETYVRYAKKSVSWVLTAAKLS